MRWTAHRSPAAPSVWVAWPCLGLVSQMECPSPHAWTHTSPAHTHRKTDGQTERWKKAIVSRGYITNQQGNAKNRAYKVVRLKCLKFTVKTSFQDILVWNQPKTDFWFTHTQTNIGAVLFWEQWVPVNAVDPAVAVNSFFVFPDTQSSPDAPGLRQWIMSCTTYKGQRHSQTDKT